MKTYGMQGWLGLPLFVISLSTVWVGTSVYVGLPKLPEIHFPKKQDSPRYLYNVSMFFPSPKNIVNESSYSLFSPSYARYKDDHGESNENIHSSYIVKYVDVTDYRRYSQHRTLKISLVKNGFEYVDLKDVHKDGSLKSDFQSALEHGLDSNLSSRIRHKLRHFFATLSDGSYLWIFKVVGEGMIIRRNRAGCKNPHLCKSIDGDEVAAKTVHIDQDLHGQPLRSMLFGLAPFLFHEKYSPLRILNIWIPLQQVRVRPLALMDVQTFNRQAHQLKYHIVNKFMSDHEDGEGGKEKYLLNDCFTSLHHEDQKWYFYDGQDSDKMIVFETTGTPHGSFMLPGEKFLRRLLDALEEIHDHVVRRKEDDCFPLALKEKIFGVLRENNKTHAKSTPTIQGAVQEIQEYVIHTLLHHGIVDEANESMCVHDVTGFKAAVKRLVQINTRVSLEMRAVGFLITHYSFMSVFATLVTIICSWKIFSFLLVNLLLKPDKFMVSVCKRCFKSLFQMPETSASY